MSPSFGIWLRKPLSVVKSTVDIAAGVAISTFNDGYMNILLMMQLMNITIGTQAFEYCDKMNERRVNHAEIQAQQSAQRGPPASQKGPEANEEFTNTEGSLYGSGIAD